MKKKMISSYSEWKKGRLDYKKYFIDSLKWKCEEFFESEEQEKLEAIRLNLISQYVENEKEVRPYELDFNTSKYSVNYISEAISDNDMMEYSMVLTEFDCNTAMEKWLYKHYGKQFLENAHQFGEGYSDKLLIADYNLLNEIAYLYFFINDFKGHKNKRPKGYEHIGYHGEFSRERKQHDEKLKKRILEMLKWHSINKQLAHELIREFKEAGGDVNELPNNQYKAMFFMLDELNDKYHMVYPDKRLAEYRDRIKPLKKLFVKSSNDKDKSQNLLEYFFPLRQKST